MKILTALTCALLASVCLALPIHAQEEEDAAPGDVGIPTADVPCPGCEAYASGAAGLGALLTGTGVAFGAPTEDDGDCACTWAEVDGDLIVVEDCHEVAKCKASIKATITPPAGLSACVQTNPLAPPPGNGVNCLPAGAVLTRTNFSNRCGVEIKDVFYVTNGTGAFVGVGQSIAGCDPCEAGVCPH